MKILINILLAAFIFGGGNRQNTENGTKSVETKLMRAGRIWSLDWSPDGKFIACGNATGLLRIYDAENLELLKILTGFTHTINGIHWSPDGRKIVASGAHEDPRVIMWDLDSKSRTIIDVHKRQVRSVRWSPKGNYFASTSHDGTIRVWTSEGEFVKLFKGANGGCVGIDWLNEDKIAASCWDNSIRTYTISGTDSLIIENGNHRRKAVLSVDWHPNGKILATGDYGNEEDTVHAVKLWTAQGQLIREMTSHQKEIRSLSWNKEGDLLATGGETVRLWNIDGDLIEVFDQNSSPVWSLDWNPNGTQIASGHNDGKIRIWDTEGKLLKLLDGHFAEISALAYSKDSTQLMMGFSDGLMRYYDLNNLTSYSTTSHKRSITNIAWSSDDQYIATSSKDGTASIWAVEDKELSSVGKYFGKDMYVKHISWSPDNKTIAYLLDNNEISVWSINGGYIYSEKNSEEVNMIDWKNGKPVGINNTSNLIGFKKGVFVKKGNKKLELIPLNNNRFALFDSDGNIVYGDKGDFIRIKETENGFTLIKLLK